MKYAIEVTQEDIDKGVRGSQCQCPIALALHRINKPRVAVGRYLVVIHEKTTKEANLPLSAQQFIYAFDQQLNVEPFSFEIDIPE